MLFGVRKQTREFEPLKASQKEAAADKAKVKGGPFMTKHVWAVNQLTCSFEEAILQVLIQHKGVHPVVPTNRKA